MKKRILLLMFLLVSCAQAPSALPTKMTVEQTATLTLAPIPTNTPTSTQTLIPAVTPTRSPDLVPGWTSYGSINQFKAVAFDQSDNLWAGGEGGVVQWHPDGSYILYTKDNGLTGNQVLCIAVALDGAIWVGTDNGASRFDGTNWQRYNTENDLAGHSTRSIVVALDGTLWFNSAQGISRFDGKTWTKYTPPGKYSFDTVAHSIAVAPDGTLWAGTAENVWHFDGTTWISYNIHEKPEHNYTTSVVVAPDGAVWVGSLGGGVSRFDGKKWTSYTTVDTYILFISVAPNGAVWIGSAFGVARFDGKTWTNYPLVEEMDHNAIRSIAAALDGTLWLATDQGVMRFDGKEKIIYNSANGLTDDHVASIVLASDGTVGAGTEFGVSRFNGKDWASQTAQNGPSSNAILSVAAATDGMIWVGTDNGISRFDGKAWSNFTTSDGLADNRVSALAFAADGALLAGTNSGISRFDGATWTDYNIGDRTGYLAKSAISSIAVASDSTVWTATQSGIWHFDGTNWTRSFTFANVVVPASDGSVWFGGYGDGVTRMYQNKQTTYTTKDGLVNDDIHSIAVAPNNTVWFGTNNGVALFDGTTWSSYSTNDGVASEYIPAIAITPDGVVWLGTNNGVSRFDGITWTNYTTTDGLPSDEVESIAVAPDGSLWFGTRKGLSHYVPEQTKTPTLSEPQNTITPQPSNAPPPIIADCGWSATVRAWVDLNGNGIRDENDTPLPDVSFHVDDTLNGYSDVSRGDGPTNWKGESQLSVFLPGCPKVQFEIYPDVPSGYRALSDVRPTSDGDAIDQVFEFGFSLLTGEPTLTARPSASSCVSHHLGFANRYDITDIAVAVDGTVWVATFNDGLRKLEAGSSEWVYLRTSDGLVNNQVRSITPLADGTIWFGTQGGASRLDSKGWSNFTTAAGLIDNNVYAIAKAPNGDVWFATAAGVSRLNEKTSTWASYKSTSITSISKAVAVSQKGAVWASIDMSYLAQIVSSGKDALKLQDKKGFAYIDQLIFAPDGMLWMVGSGFLNKYNPATKELHSYSNFETNGAFASYARAFALAPDGSVWIAAGRDAPVVYHFLPKLGSKSTNAWRIYDERDGIPSLPDAVRAEDNVRAIAVSPNGDIWVATTEHASLCHFEEQ